MVAVPIPLATEACDEYSTPGALDRFEVPLDPFPFALASASLP